MNSPPPPPRKQPGHKIIDPIQKSRVCRQLFPTDEPSDDVYKRAIEENLQKELEEQQKKWNFDIKEEKMIAKDGTYLWTKDERGRYDWIGRPNTEREEEGTAPKNEDQSPDSSEVIESNVLQNGVTKDDIK